MFLKLPGNSHVQARLRTPTLSGGIKTGNKLAGIILLLFFKVDICIEDKKTEMTCSKMSIEFFERWNYKSFSIYTFLDFPKIFTWLFLKSVRKTSHQNCCIFNTRISKWKNIIPYFAQSDESLSVKLHQYIKLNLINWLLLFDTWGWLHLPPLSSLLDPMTLLIVSFFCRV